MLIVRSGQWPVAKVDSRPLVTSVALDKGHFTSDSGLLTRSVSPNQLTITFTLFPYIALYDLFNSSQFLRFIALRVTRV